MRAWALSLALVGCAHPRQARPEAPPPDGIKLPADPTVRGARLVPEVLERGAGDRGVVLGVRYERGPAGSLRTSDERLDDAARGVPLPSRLGGGFVFVLGDTVYRSGGWLSPLVPLFRSSRGIRELSPGLDRMYVRTNAGSHVAFDPRSGSLEDLGPWPRDPSIGAYVAIDGWRAFALTDVQGLVETHDAGRTWAPVDPSLRVESMAPVRQGPDGVTWIVDSAAGAADGVLLRDRRLPPPGAHSPEEAPRCAVVLPSLDVERVGCGQVRAEEAPPAPPADAPFATLVEDGWPLGDGTAVLARRGELARVSLVDGSVVEGVAGGLPALDRCRAVPLGRHDSPSAFGLVCGAPHGETELFAFDEVSRRVVDVAHFPEPRVVETSSEGGWLVHGACAARPEPLDARAFCVGTRLPSRVPAYAWRPVHVDGALASATGLAADGRVMRLVWPGTPGEAGLIFTGADGASEVVPLHEDDEAEGVRRFFARAVWSSALEERTPGVVSAWAFADGAVLGVEFAHDGTIRHGPYIRDPGSVFVAGRYGLGWTRSHLGFETTDGGMTWRHFSAPTLRAPSVVRACGPLGCVASGWVRVGWGEVDVPRPPLPPPLPPLRGAPARRLALSCSLASPLPPPRAREDDPGAFEGLGARRGSTLAGSDDDGPRSSAWPAPEGVSRADTLVRADVSSPAGTLARVYAWGPTAGDWARLGRWSIRWRSPFGGARSSVASTAAPAPFGDAASARSELGFATTASWSVTVGEDAAHALLVAGRPHGPREVSLLDEGGGVAPVTRIDGEPWGAIDAAARIGASWYVVTAADASRQSLLLLRVEAGRARLVATVPRHFPSVPRVRLARSIDEARAGVVVDGEPSAERSVADRWVVPVHLESGEVDAPEPLGAEDLSDRDGLAPCADGAGSGWLLETPWSNGAAVVDLGDPEVSARLDRPFLRVRLSSDRACLVALTGAAVGAPLADVAARTRSIREPAEDEPVIPVVVAEDAPVELRCRRRGTK